MNLRINQNSSIREEEIILNCPVIDRKIKNLIEYIHQLSETLEGSIDNQTFYVPLDTVLYIETVDRKTFFYDEHRTFQSSCSLSELEEKLSNSRFARISKNNIVNVSKITSSYNMDNHKLGIILSNGQRLVAGRVFAKKISDRINYFNLILPEENARREVESFMGNKFMSVLNNKTILKFREIPKRVIAFSYYAAELLCALGLEKRIAGIIAMPGEDQYWLPEYAKALKKIPVIMCADLYVPYGEELAALKPDFVVLSFYYRDYMDRLGISADNIPFYIFEGSVPGKATLETVYKDIFNLGQIFHVEDKAYILVSSVRDTLFSLPLRPFKKRNPRIFVYDSGKNAPFTAFADTLENDLIRLAGGENVFGKKHGTYGEISWQEAAETNPDFIIIHDYIDYMSVDEKTETIKSVPEFMNCTAIKENRLITLPLSQFFPGIQNSYAVKKMCMEFYKNRF